MSNEIIETNDEETPVAITGYEFTVILNGYGETPELAYLDAVRHFCVESEVLVPKLFKIEDENSQPE